MSRWANRHTDHLSANRAELLIPAWVLSLRMGCTEKVILAYLLRRIAAPSGIGWPTRPAMAAELGLPARTFAVALERLTKRGHAVVRLDDHGAVAAVEVPRGTKAASGSRRGLRIKAVRTPPVAGTKA